MDSSAGMPSLVSGGKHCLLDDENFFRLFSPKSFVGIKKCATFATANENDGAIAQLVEQRTENPCVPGSFPGGTTIIIAKWLMINHLAVFFCCGRICLLPLCYHTKGASGFSQLVNPLTLRLQPRVPYVKGWRKDAILFSPYTHSRDFLISRIFSIVALPTLRCRISSSSGMVRNRLTSITECPFSSYRNTSTSLNKLRAFVRTALSMIIFMFVSFCLPSCSFGRCFTFLSCLYSWRFLVCCP